MVQTPHSLERTRLLKNGSVFHYTCNPPSRDILEKYGITGVGASFGCRDNNEVLLIPKEVYVKLRKVKNVDELRGLEQNLAIISEQMLRTLSNKKSKRSMF